MPDGSITFSTEVDNKKSEKDLAKIERDIERLEKRISSHKEAKLPLVQQAEELGAKLDVAKAKLAELQNQQQIVNTGLSGSDPQAYIDAYAQKPAIDSAVTHQQVQVDSLQKKWDAVNAKIEMYNQKIAVANERLTVQTAKAGTLAAQQTAGGANMAAAMAKAQKASALFQKRIIGVVKQVFVFSIISKALTGIVKYMSKATKTNEEFNAQLAKLKGALLTAFQPIYDTLIPALISLMRVATSVVQVVAQVFSLLSGKTAAENAKNAQTLYEEANAIDEVGSSAKRANKSLASFDEINNLSSNENAGSTGGSEVATPDFADFDSAEYKKKIDELTVYISGALLALGAILTFSGVKIGLGIALMAAGAIGLISEVAVNWNSMSDELKNAITMVLGVLGTAALAIGAILVFSGANLPLGIGLMIAGATMLATAAVINWEVISKELQGSIGGVVAVVSTALLVLGAVLAFSGVALPLGIALIALGAAGLATTATLNWNTIEKELQGPIGAVVALVSGALLAIGVVLCFTGVGIPLGIAMIAAGAAGLVTVIAINWNTIVTTIKNVFGTVNDWIQSHGFVMMILGIVLLFTGVAIPIGLALMGLGITGMVNGKDPLWNTIFDKIKEVWGKIKSFWNTHIAKFFTAKWWGDLAKGAINGFLKWIFNGLNSLIDKLNSFGFTLPDVLGGGRIGFNIRKLSIPQLAQGAVLPANKPFLAVVGDQKNGTNIEAPLETIKQALAEVMATQGTGDINIRFTGELAQLARILKPVIEKEDRRVGGSLVRKAGT